MKIRVTIVAVLLTTLLAVCLKSTSAQQQATSTVQINAEVLAKAKALKAEHRAQVIRLRDVAKAHGVQATELMDLITTAVQRPTEAVKNARKDLGHGVDLAVVQATLNSAPPTSFLLRDLYHRLNGDGGITAQGDDLTPCQKVAFNFEAQCIVLTDATNCPEAADQVYCQCVGGVDIGGFCL